MDMGTVSALQYRTLKPCYHVHVIEMEFNNVIKFIDVTTRAIILFCCLKKSKTKAKHVM